MYIQLGNEIMKNWFKGASQKTFSFLRKDTVMIAPPKMNINTKSAVRPRNEPSSNILQ